MESRGQCFAGGRGTEQARETGDKGPLATCQSGQASARPSLRAEPASAQRCAEPRLS